MFVFCQKLHNLPALSEGELYTQAPLKGFSKSKVLTLIIQWNKLLYFFYLTSSALNICVNVVTDQRADQVEKDEGEDTLICECFLF